MTKAQEQTQTNFSVVDAADWDQAANVETYVEQLTPDQTIEGGYVQDPTNANVIYFATSSADGTLSIYRYDTSTYFFERLWRADATTDKEWNVVGYDNGNVIFVEVAGGYTLDACGSAMLDGVDGTDGATLWSLPSTYAESWASGPVVYTAAEDVVTSARDEQTACRDGQQTEQQPEDGEEQS